MLLSPNAPQHVFTFCPKCGQKTLHLASEKKFHCEACGLIYYINSAGAVAGILLDENNRILFTRRAKDPAKGTLGLPGGFVDFGESLEQALRREILEEVNMEISGCEYLCSYPNQYLYAGILYQTIDVFYICRIQSIRPHAANDEILEYFFRPPQEINLQEIGIPSIRKAVELFIYGTAGHSLRTLLC